MSLKFTASLSTRALLVQFAVAGLAAMTCVNATGCGWGVAPLLPAASVPQVGVPSGPVLGYLFSSDGTLRPMLGVRGAARLGETIVPAGIYVAGSTSTRSSAGLLEDAQGALFAFRLPLADALRVTDGLPERVKIAFAPSGASAIAYAAGSSAMTLITGLPGHPQAQKMTVSAGLRVALAAVSDAGTVAVAAAGTPMVIGRLGANGQLSPLSTVGEADGLNFITQSEDLLVADGAGKTVVKVQNVSGNPSVEVLSVAGMNRPVAIAATGDRHWAVIANAGDQSLLRVDLTGTSTPGRIACACQPTELNSLAGNGTFRVNTPGTGPVWMVDLTAAVPQMLFVPAKAPTTP